MHPSAPFHCGRLAYASSALLAITVLLSAGLAPAADEGFTSIFDGKTLQGWSGDASLWRVEEGVIVGETKADAPVEANQFLIWSDGEADDFELKAEFKIESGNSGIQIRSFRIPEEGPYRVGGYQADFDAGNAWSGTCYGEKFRGILAKRGEVATIGEDGKPTVTASLGETEALGSAIRPGDWNEYHIVARGPVITLFINGQKMSEIVDEDLDTRLRTGLIAFQLHKGDPMKVSFRNIRLKRLPLADVAKIVFVAGKPSHGPRQHEHNAGCLLLAGLLNTHHADKVLATVYRNGWPSDPTAFDAADAVVVYSDGGKGHPAYYHLDDLARLRTAGVGLGAIHYAVEMEPGESNDALIASIGGAFEVNYSVNPHWTAPFEKYPQHPVASGLTPFEINDEWYFNMRFTDPSEKLVPILSAVPPAETMSRPDGHHSGNPAVRQMVADGLPQHLCWTYQTGSGSRGFGFTGGHNHDNWASDPFRLTALNAICWIAGVEIPAGGIVTPTPDAAALDANLDPKSPKPAQKAHQAKP
jgi:Domain of Unknown Function (DUF1080)/Trehalose utilisation